MLQGKAIFHRLKEERPNHAGFNRRMFLMTTAMTGLATGVVVPGARPASAALDDHQSETVLRMAQDIYPHPDLVPLEAYQAIADSVIAGVSEDETARKALTEGLVKLDAHANKVFGNDFVGVEDADGREGLLRAFQHEDFFQNIRWAAYFGIYNNKDLWPLFGYQGSSVEHGGYINRGFSDITFVPEGPTEAERIAAAK